MIARCLKLYPNNYLSTLHDLFWIWQRNTSVIKSVTSSAWNLTVAESQTSSINRQKGKHQIEDKFSCSSLPPPLPFFPFKEKTPMILLHPSLILTKMSTSYWKTTKKNYGSVDLRNKVFLLSEAQFSTVSWVFVTTSHSLQIKKYTVYKTTRLAIEEKELTNV